MRNLRIFRDAVILFRSLVMAALIAAWLANPATAIDPNRMISQYIRTHWESERALSGGSVTALAQTADGYLWIGTQKGLFRFDGANFEAFHQASPNAFSIGPVQQLVADAYGNLWILLQNTKLLRYSQGKFELGRDEAEFGITAIGRRSDGTILFASLAYGILTFRDGKFYALDRSSTPATAAGSTAQGVDNLSSRLSWATGVTPHRFAEPNSAVFSLAETDDGKLWLGTQDKGLFYSLDGKVESVNTGKVARKINCLLALPNHELWIGTDEGIVRWDGTSITTSGIPSALRAIRILSLVKDRDANVWVGTANGLVRVNASGASVEPRYFKHSEAVTAILEDREGNLWVGSAGGMDRLRDSSFITFAPAGLQSESSGPVYVDEDGHTWFAPFAGGLHWLKEQTSGSVTNDSLNNDVVYSIAGGKRELWIGRQKGGLTHLYGPGLSKSKTYKQKDGLAQNAVYAVHQGRDGSVWAGTLSEGVSVYRNGYFTTYTSANGLSSNTVVSIAETPDGTMWFATPNGLDSLSQNRWRILGTRDGLPSENVNCVTPEATGALWIGTASGLAFMDPSGRVQIPDNLPAHLQEQILGIATDQFGWLWVSTSNHVLRVQREKLRSGTLTESDVRVYGLEDGLLGTEGTKRHRSVITDPSGRIWFSMNRGLSVVDPARAIVSSAPAIVQIDGLTADGNPVNLQNAIRFPGVRRKITFTYAAASLSIPDRVQFKYKLDGEDDAWSKPVSTREVTFNNLASGQYRFRLIASNSDGLWNSAEAAVPFVIEPANWQTWWFRLSAILVVGLAILMFFRLRVLALKRQMNMRFEERLAERTRIAQALHDTLLQGFLSASMQLHVANDHLDPNSPAKPFVARVLELMTNVIDEGRNAVRGLRPASQESLDLELAFSRIQQEIDTPAEIDFRVLAEGKPRPLRPMIHEEVYRIGREALVNAFRHSAASNFEVEIEYAANHLRLLVRDNGIGIDPEVVRAGRDGHWGLSGMRERAERIGAKLRVLSAASSGTEVELSVPGHIAFQFASDSRWFWLSRLKERAFGEKAGKFLGGRKS